MALRDHLDTIFDADRRARDAERRLLAEGDDASLSALLAEATRSALALESLEEAEPRLVRLADLCAQVPGPRMAEALIDILDHESPRVRVEAGEALRDVAYERFKEVARAIERALDAKRGGHAMQELPFVLTEIHDPDPLPLIARFLEHADPNVVAAAIEALADYGSPAAIPHLERLVDDAREAELEDLDDGAAAIGDLAREALEELGADEDA
jgi:HEAT repeat protein